MNNIKSVLIIVAIISIGVLGFNHLDLGAGVLDSAVERCDVAEVQRELGKGADVNANSRRGTALHRASSAGHYEIAKILIANGANVNAKIEENLLGVVSKGYLSALGRDEGVDMAFGATPLHLAIFYGHKNVVELLLENGADPSMELTVGPDWAPKYRRTTLQLAKESKNDAMLKTLTKQNQ